MIDQRFEQALRASDPLGALRTLASKDLDRGVSREAVLASFEQVRAALREQVREADEDAVLDVMDFLVGWCSPHRKLPEPTNQV